MLLRGAGAAGAAGAAAPLPLLHGGRAEAEKCPFAMLTRVLTY